MILTRYVFNSTKIKNNNLRKSNNLKQILFYLNSKNFEHLDQSNTENLNESHSLVDYTTSNLLSGIVEEILDDIRKKKMVEVKFDLITKFANLLSLIF